MDYETKEYKLTFFEVSDFQDNFGNYWCNAAFDGVSEPVRWVVKDPAKVKEGESYYGKITVEKSKAGNTYLRFRREERQEGKPVPANAGGYVPKDTFEIMAQWALGRAYEKRGAVSEALKDAAWLINGVYKLKATKDEQKAPEKPTAPTESTGYDKWKTATAKLKEEKVEDGVIEDFDTTEELDLDSIPF